MRLVVVISLCLAILSAFASAVSAEVAVKKTDSGVEVTIGGQPFTTYIFDSGFKPILWPIVGPSGKEMTRAWPMRPGNADEKMDHVHQKSFWFTHGNVNGIDFWAETAKAQGKQVQKELVKAEGGKLGTIVTTNDWLGPDGAKIIEDVRTLRFGGDEQKRDEQAFHDSS